MFRWLASDRRKLNVVDVLSAADGQREDLPSAFKSHVRASESWER